jgi:hypothetical protein
MNGTTDSHGKTRINERGKQSKGKAKKSKEKPILWPEYSAQSIED